MFALKVSIFSICASNSKIVCECVILEAINWEVRQCDSECEDLEKAFI